jgi:hypothetical protein
VAAGERAERAADEAYKTRVRLANRAIVECDPREFFDEHGNFIPVNKWTAAMAAAVASVEVVIKNAKAGDGITDRVLKIRFWNKNTAIELDYKSFGLMEPEPDDAGRDVPTFVFPEGTRIRIE